VDQQLKMEWKARYQGFWFYGSGPSSMDALASIYSVHGRFTAELYVPQSYVTKRVEYRDFDDIRSAALWCMEHAKQYE